MNVVETSGLGKRYRKTWGAARLHARSARRPCRRTRRAERGRQDDAAPLRGRSFDRHDRQRDGTRRPHAGSLDALERVAFVAQDAPLHRHLSVGAMVGVAGQPESPLRRGTSQSAPSCPRDPTSPEGRQALRRSAGPARSRPWRSPAIPTCSSSTNLSHGSTRSHGTTSWPLS